MNHHHIKAGQHSASDPPRYAYPIGVGDRASPPVRTTQSNRQLSKRFQARPSLTARTAARGPVVDSSDENGVVNIDNPNSDKQCSSCARKHAHLPLM
jgi:hypothetical protein